MPAASFDLFNSLLLIIQPHGENTTPPYLFKGGDRSSPHNPVGEQRVTGLGSVYRPLARSLDLVNAASAELLAETVDGSAVADVRKHCRRNGVR